MFRNRLRVLACVLTVITFAITSSSFTSVAEQWDERPNQLAEQRNENPRESYDEYDEKDVRFNLLAEEWKESLRENNNSDSNRLREELIEFVETESDDRDRDLAKLNAFFGVYLFLNGDFEPAYVDLVEGKERFESGGYQNDENYPGTVSILLRLLNKVGNYELGYRIGSDILTDFRRIWGPEHSETAKLELNLADIALNAGRLDTAGELLGQGVQRIIEDKEVDSLLRYRALLFQCKYLIERNQLSEAAGKCGLLRDVVQIELEESDPRIGMAFLVLGRLQRRMGLLSASEQTLRDELRRASRYQDTESLQPALYYELAETLVYRGKYDEAVDLLQNEMNLQMEDFSDPQVRKVFRNYARGYRLLSVIDERRHNYTEALKNEERAIALQRDAATDLVACLSDAEAVRLGRLCWLARQRSVNPTVFDRTYEICHQNLQEEGCAK